MLLRARLSTTVSISLPTATRGYTILRTSQRGMQRIDKHPNVVNEKAPDFGCFFVWCEGLLLLQEAGFKHNAAAVNLAVYLLVVLG